MGTHLNNLNNWGNSNEYQQHMFYKENSKKMLHKYSLLLILLLSVHLSGRAQLFKANNVVS